MGILYGPLSFEVGEFFPILLKRWRYHGGILVKRVCKPLTLLSVVLWSFLGTRREVGYYIYSPCWVPWNLLAGIWKLSRLFMSPSPSMFLPRYRLLVLHLPFFVAVENEWLDKLHALRGFIWKIFRAGHLCFLCITNYNAFILAWWFPFQMVEHHFFHKHLEKNFQILLEALIYY